MDKTPGGIRIGDTNMQSSEADPDTRVEVDLMILDYLVSIALESALCTQQTKNGDRVNNENAMDWPADIITQFKSLIPSTEPISDDIQTRLRLLNLTNSFSHYTTSSTTKKMEVIIDFLSLCNRDCPKTAESQWASIGVQLIAQVAMEVSKHTGKAIQDTITQSTAQVDKTLHKDPWRKMSLTHLQPPTGTSLHGHIEIISRRLAPDRLQREISSTLLGIAKAQDPPILIQLERGKIFGLSRAETLQLKDRLGIR